MGSLMSGWNSPFVDSDSLILERNKSLTKGEIEAFWKVKKKVEDEHLKSVSSPLDKSGGGKMYERSSSMPSTSRQMETETDLQKLILKNGWWRRSNSAFLNEPPVFEGNTNTYASQFHIAKKEH
ncbi:hypothetical protein ACFE04_028852 [Oxalis oulophora]